MKKETLQCLEKDVGLRAWQLIELNKFMDDSRSETSLKNPQDFLNLLAGNLGEMLRAKAYKKFVATSKIDLTVCLADMFFIMLNLIRSHNLELEDVIRIGLVRYKEKIWITKRKQL